MPLAFPWFPAPGPGQSTTPRGRVEPQASCGHNGRCPCFRRNRHHCKDVKIIGLNDASILMRERLGGKLGAGH